LRIGRPNVRHRATDNRRMLARRGPLGLHRFIRAEMSRYISRTHYGTTTGTKAAINFCCVRHHARPRCPPPDRRSALHLGWYHGCHDDLTSQDVSFEPHCNHQADLLCPGVSRSSDSWKQWFQSCMQQMRIGCVTNDKCPYPGLNCRCYNGCVQENWRSQKDVGRYCHGQCQMSGDLPNC